MNHVGKRLFAIRFYTCVNHPFTAIRKRSPDRTKYTFCFFIEEFDKFGVIDMFGVGLRSPTYKRFVRISYIIFFLIFINFVSLLFPRCFLSVSLLFLFRFLSYYLRIVFIVITDSYNGLSCFLWCLRY